MNLRVFRAFALFLLLAGMGPGAPAALAQTYRGHIAGVITDASGAVVPGAKVTITNVGTGLTRETNTDAEGYYAVAELPIGE